MKISLKWLKEFTCIQIPVDELISKLVSIGFDIENIENQADSLDKFVIGKVLEKKKHPNADKLVVCQVDTGEKIRNIVCGAPNVDIGQFVCVALPGAMIPNSGTALLKTKIRGEISEGMICSAKELNLGDEHSGIMVLNKIGIGREELLVPGKSFAGYLGYDDVIIEIGVTPNRGDLLSHIGVAREAGAVTGIKLNVREPFCKENSESISDYISVEIEDTKACLRYCGRIVKNVKVSESPEWLKSRIISAGLRPVNNIVDITNYVMLECGQPLHAFDYKLIKGKKIIVKRAGVVNEFTTLDGKCRKLKDDILLICDASKPVALAGIMGGKNSEIRDDTEIVLIESAYFAPVLTRQTSKYLSLQTDSSYRFERGIDIEKVKWACNRAAELIAEYGGGQIVNGLIDEYPEKVQKRVVSLRKNRVERILGTEIESKRLINLLESLEIALFSEEGDTLLFEIPYHREQDLNDEIDLIEEVARLYGYENIKAAEFYKIHYDLKKFDDSHFDFRNRIREHLAGRGFMEVITNTLVDEKKTKFFGKETVKLANPLTEGQNILRPDFFTDTLNTVKYNFDNMNRSLKLFEIGNVFHYSDKKELEEENVLQMTLAGEYDGKSFDQNKRDFDLMDMKGEVESLLEKLNIENYNLFYYNYVEQFDYVIEYKVREDTFAKIYQFGNKVLREFDIDKPVIVCELH